MDSAEQPAMMIGDLIDDNYRHIRLRLIAGEGGLQRLVVEKNLHRPGLALAGFFGVFSFQRIQLIGNTELAYLNDLKSDQRYLALQKLFSFELPCVIVTDDNKVLPEIKKLGEQNNIPIISTDLTTTEIAFLLSNYLSNRFAPSISINGALVDVYGTGLLFIGKPAIGKSEIALDLIERGHRFVADDVVTLTRKATDVIIGTCPDLLRHIIEIRGVGVINVRNMFGVKSIRVQKRVEVVVELTKWDDKEGYERLGLEEQYTEYLGMPIPLITLPIFPGKNITVIAEAIALNHHLKIYGENAALELSDYQKKRMLKNDSERIWHYLEWDRE
jgi:HPr kinase/phosphorylase